MAFTGPVKNKNTTLWLATGIITIGLLIVALLVIRRPAFIFPAGLLGSIKEADAWLEATISKEALLLLLAVGIAGVLGLSRKNKDIQKGMQQSTSEDSSDP